MVEWTLVNLGILCDITLGRTPSRRNDSYWGKGTSWVSISDLKEKYINETKEEITDLGAQESRSRLIPRGTLMMSFKLSVGKLAFAGKDIYTNEAIASLPIKKIKKIDKNYLYYALQNIPLIGSNQAAMGKTLNKVSLSKLEIPYPKSLDTQKRIAQVLTDCETLITQRKESITLLDELVKSTFLEMFGDRDGKENLLGDLIEIQSGLINPNEKPYAEMFHVGGRNIESNTGKLVNLKKAKEENLISGKYLFESDYLLYSKIRPYLNKVSVMNFTGICSADVYPIRPKDSSQLNIHFLKNELQSQKFITYANNNSGRANIPKINRKALVAYKLVLPDLNKQNQFAQIVEKIEATKTLYQSHLTELENLYARLSQDAFKGKLDVSKVVLRDEFSGSDTTVITSTSTTTTSRPKPYGGDPRPDTDASSEIIKPEDNYKPKPIADTSVDPIRPGGEDRKKINPDKTFDNGNRGNQLNPNHKDPDNYDHGSWGGSHNQKGAKENEDEYYDKGSWGGKFDKDISKPDYYPVVGEDGLIKKHEEYEQEFEEQKASNKRRKKEQQKLKEYYASLPLEDAYLQKFLLKRYHPKEPFTYKEIIKDLNKFTYDNTNHEIEYEVCKDIIFTYISDKKWIQQIFDETDGQLKLQLTDEAFTS